tara:strand:- start:358 stop:1539 length:1182 start_codon:yes stop_codon:yes gene_type:complete
MSTPNITEKLDGRLIIIDDYFSAPELNELVRDVQNWPYLYGEVDDGDLPPTGMSTGEYTGTKTFHALWNFCEKHLPQTHGCILKRSHANIFAPREPAYYHVDDESDEAWTFMFYANNNWDINDGGETKFITNLQNKKENYEGTEYPEIIAIPPIPGRMLLWKSNVLHTATPMRNTHRFTPTFKFIKFLKEKHGKAEGGIVMGNKNTYPWHQEYTPPLPITDIKHTIASIDVYETNLPNIDNDSLMYEIVNNEQERIDANPEDTHYEDIKFPGSDTCMHFMGEVEKAVTAYANKDVELTGIWTHKTEPNGSTAFHSHTKSLYSFVYYPQHEEGQGDIHFTVFINDMPRFEKVIQPKAGMLLIFDSKISHYTGKNVTNTDRYSISGNFNIRSNDG